MSTAAVTEQALSETEHLSLHWSGVLSLLCVQCDQCVGTLSKEDWWWWWWWGDDDQVDSERAERTTTFLQLR